jgi:hypothetical protein
MHQKIGVGIDSVTLAATATAVTVSSATAVTAATTTTAAATTAATTEATASASASTEATATTTPGAFFLGSGLIDGQRATVVLLAIQGGNRRLSFVVAGHLDETKTLAPACVAIIYDLSRDHGTVSGEQLLQCGAVYIVAEVPHI